MYSHETARYVQQGLTAPATQVTLRVTKFNVFHMQYSLQIDPNRPGSRGTRSPDQVLGSSCQL